MTLPGLVITEMKSHEFQNIRDFVRDRTGIEFADEKKFLLEGKLRRRLDALKIDNYAAYFQYLRNGNGQEMDRLIEAITTNESFFMREAYQFEAMTKLIREGGKKRVKVWSAGCSTGEEPHSIAIMLRDVSLFIRDLDWSILASDMDNLVLAKARAGVYGEYSFRGCDDGFKRRNFQTRNGLFTVNQELRERIEWQRLNLSDRAALKPLRGFDFIFCRNVFIYFSEAVRTACVAAFYDALNRGGILFIGHSESLHNLANAFHPVRVGKALCYRKERS